MSINLFFSTTAQIWDLHKFFLIQSFVCLPADFCIPPFPFPCHEMADCSSTGYNYTCKCKPGYTGSGKECTGMTQRCAQHTQTLWVAHVIKHSHILLHADINECMDPSACPNAKYECMNTPGSVRCSCRYQKTRDSDGCGEWHVLNPLNFPSNTHFFFFDTFKIFLLKLSNSRDFIWSYVCFTVCFP